MGDDAELYMEMQDPFFWDWVEECNHHSYFDDDDYEYNGLTNQVHKKKNLAVFIDAESVSSSHASKINGQIRRIGELFEARYYALQKDNSTSSWKQEAKRYGFKPILIFGPPEKNKIDNKIIKDAKKMLEQSKQVDIFCIVSRDGDFTPLVKYLREHKKRVVILATKQTSKKLKNASNEVKGI